MHWVATISGATELERAAREVVEEARFRLEGRAADLAIVFVSPHHSGGYSQLPELIADKLGARVIFGCSAAGVIGDGREVEGRPGLSLTAAALPGVELTPFHFSGPHLPSAAPDARSPADPDRRRKGEQQYFLLVADPFSIDTEAILAQLDEAYRDCPKIGGLASGGAHPGANALFAGQGHFDHGMAGVALSGDIRLETIVAQGCRPIGDPMFVTGARKNSILEIDGRPAVDVLKSLYSSLDARDQDLFRSSLLLGIAMKEQGLDFRHGDFLIRNILGVGSDEKSIVVGTRPRSTQVVQFHLRDARTADEDLELLLSRCASEGAPTPPAGALLFSCLGRGAGLFGVPDHDTDAFRTHLGAVPLGGFFCNGEIGPIQGRTHLHGFTSSFGLFHGVHPESETAD